ncbi:ML domain-containing protein [Streptomyces sp. NPDC086554]|uniref:ML domain-containing protein n=1 Tax=Streptomyces sp. NPDC086554 TaxID=3154864 RepID=UPI00342AA779
MTSWSYSNCGLESDALQIQSVTASPDPLDAKESSRFTIKGFAQEPIEEGAYADVVIKLGLIKILSKRFDLLEELRRDQFFTLVSPASTSPLPKGEIELTFTPPLPNPTPQAKFSVSLRAFTVDDEDLACLDFKLDYMKRPL